MFEIDNQFVWLVATTSSFGWWLMAGADLF
jgi:hypothetical protein